AFTLVDTDLLAAGPGFTAPISLTSVFNLVRVTVHPKTSVAGTVLFSVLNAAEPIQPGESREYWDTYSDPNGRDRLIGAKNFTAPVATTDYTANTVADGSGADRTANIALLVVTFASSSKTTLANNGSDTVYMTKRQLRADGLFDNSP